MRCKFATFISWRALSPSASAAGRSLIGGNGSTTATLIYNALGQLVQTSGSASGTILYAYDEAGHVLEEAYRLNTRPRYIELFGNAEDPYPDNYQPRVDSREHVINLAGWYAQAHHLDETLYHGALSGDAAWQVGLLERWSDAAALGKDGSGCCGLSSAASKSEERRTIEQPRKPFLRH